MRHTYSNSTALCGNRFVAKSRMCVGPFEHCWNPQSFSSFQGFQGTQRPAVNDVYFVRHFFESVRHDSVVQYRCAHPAQQLVWNSQLTPRQRRANAYVCEKRARDGTRKHGYARASRSQTADLFPRGIADSSSADFMRKTVENSHGHTTQKVGPKSGRLISAR